jgi:hypothetical protein
MLQSPEKELQIISTSAEIKAGRRKGAGVDSILCALPVYEIWDNLSLYTAVD